MGKQEKEEGEILLKSYVPSNTLLIRSAIIVLGAMVVSLVSGTANAIDNLTTMIQSSESFSNYQISAIQTICFMGAYFTFVSGLILDRMGPIISLSLSALFVIFGYIFMSISYFTCPSGSTIMFIMILIGYGCVGLGSGATFLCALGTSIKTLTKYPGAAVSLPGVCMSLSMAFTIFIENGFLRIYNCSSCWGDAIVALLGVIMPFFFVGIWMIAIGSYLTPLQRDIKVVKEISKSEDNVEVETLRGGEGEGKVQTNLSKSTVSELLCILFNSYFYLLSFGYFCAISYGLIIVFQTTKIWASVGGNAEWVGMISTLFSFANAVANIICGILYDVTVRRGYLSKQTFMMIYFVYCGLTLFLLGIIPFADVSSSTFLQIIYAGLMISVGFGWGCAFTLFPVLTGEVFGSLNFGFNFSCVQLGSFVATFTVPNIAAFLFNLTDGFTILFFIYFGLMVVVILANLTVKPKENAKMLPPFVLRIKAKIERILHIR